MSAGVANAAQKATNFANQTVETARFDVLKEPLGFIKIVQFLFAIFAFATAVNGASNVQIWISCNPSTTPNVTTPASGFGYTSFQGSFGYPYDLQHTQLTPSPNCNAGGTQPAIDRSTISTSSNNIVSSAEFFVFTGVTAMLYSLALGIVYVFFRHKYNNLVFFSLIDFAVTCLFALFWFAGSIAWAKAVTDIQNFCNPDNIISSLTSACPLSSTNCTSMTYPTYANIIVSCIFGFGNVILWLGDVWFVLKETTWYKTRQEIARASQNVTNNPISTNDINITAHYNPTDYNPSNNYNPNNKI